MADRKLNILMHGLMLERANIIFVEIWLSQGLAKQQIQPYVNRKLFQNLKLIT
jgi:hypothetical protein